MNNIQYFLDVLELAPSIEGEEEVFALAQEQLSADDFSTFTAIAPSKFLDDPEFNQ